jgi:hypothetical protein
MHDDFLSLGKFRSVRRKPCRMQLFAPVGRLIFDRHPCGGLLLSFRTAFAWSLAALVMPVRSCTLVAESVVRVHRACFRPCLQAKPALGQGRLQRQIRRAFCGRPVLTSSQATTAVLRPAAGVRIPLSQKVRSPWSASGHVRPIGPCAADVAPPEIGLMRNPLRIQILKSLAN